jgi:hypothetical protein
MGNYLVGFTDVMAGCTLCGAHMYTRLDATDNTDNSCLEYDVHAFTAYLYYTEYARRWNDHK